MAKKKISHLNEEFDVKLFAIIAKRNFYILVILMATALTSAFLYLRYTHPVYQSEAIVKIGTVNNATAVLNIQSPQMYDAMGINQLAGDIEILRSRLMVDRVLSKMPLEVSYYAQGTVLDEELYKNSPFEVEFYQLDSGICDFPFYIKFLENKRLEMTNNWNGNKLEGIYNIGQWYTIPGMKFRINILNYDIIQKQQNQIQQDPFYFIINNPNTLLSRYFIYSSVVLLNQGAQTIKISFKDKNPQKAADFVNTMAKEYDEYDKENKSAGANKSLEFINETINTIDGELKNSEFSLELFKKQNKIINPVQNATDVLNHINTLVDQRVEMQLNSAILSRLEKDIKNNKRLDQILPLLAGTYSDPLIQSMVVRIQELEDKRSNMKFQATEENAAIKSLDIEIDRQRMMLTVALKNATQSLNDKVKSIDERIADFESGFTELPSKEAEMARLQRLYEVNQKFYQLLLEKKIEFSITRAGIVTDNVILQRGQVTYIPLSPNRRLIISGSVLIGFILSFIIIFVKYLIYNEITSLEEINQYTDASLLGIIPKYKKDIPISQLLVDKNPKSAISESFRSVRTNLQFISNEPGPKILAVTSTISGEGKTFVAINLAGVIAFSDKRVVIIDLDMRKPKIHLGFNVENINGMSTILIGKDSPDNCINKSSLKNLDFITAGPIPPNPSELILSGRMTELLDYLKSKYDIIIIDTPPVGIVTDGLKSFKKLITQFILFGPIILRDYLYVISINL